MRVVVCLDFRCRVEIYPTEEGARSVPRYQRSSPSSRDLDPRDRDFHPAGPDQDPPEVRPGRQDPHRSRGFRREVTISDLCRREGIKPGVFYAWTKEFMEAGKERLTWDTVRDATRQEIEHLKRENYDLKQLVADLSLEVHRFKKTAIPAFERAAGA